LWGSNVFFPQQFWHFLDQNNGKLVFLSINFLKIANFLYQKIEGRKKKKKKKGHCGKPEKCIE
jgi:hypothetical protein